MKGVLGAVAGALVGAIVADLVGQPDLRVALAIAGSFIGGTLATGIPRPQGPARRDDEPPRDPLR